MDPDVHARSTSVQTKVIEAAGPIRVLIVGAQRMLVDAFRSIMRYQGIEVLEPADPLGGPAELVSKLRPDVVVVDVSPGRGGLALGDQIRRSDPHAKMIALTTRTDRDGEHAVLTRRYDGHVTGDAPASELVAAIRSAAGGGDALSWRLPRRSSPRKAIDQEAILVDQLTPREREVLALIVAAASSEEIARRLSISVNTVRSHIQSVLTKLQVHSRLEAAAFAARHGLVATAPSRWYRGSPTTGPAAVPEWVAASFPA